VVYPRQQEVYVYASPTQIQVLQLHQDLDGSDLIPGFRLPLAALFQDDPE
jgi:Uma2 family endonuclease